MFVFSGILCEGMYLVTCQLLIFLEFTCSMQNTVCYLKLFVALALKFNSIAFPVFELIVVE